MAQNWAQRYGVERDVERRTRQIKEIVRLGTALRADSSLEQTLTQMVEAVRSTLGFGAAALNLIHPGDERMDVVATTGIAPEEVERLRAAAPLATRLVGMLRPEFRIGNSTSYFISHRNKRLWDGVESVIVSAPLPPNALHPVDAWHPEDALLTPLMSPRNERLLGILSLDQPEDNKIPSLETLEIVELFASQAALAIDTSRLFQEREHERRTLEAGLFEMLYHLEQVRQGNLDVRAQLSGTTLAPMAESLNAVLHTLGALLADARSASEVVSENATVMRESAGELAARAQQQEEEILEASSAAKEMAASVRTIAAVAHGASDVAQEAIEISQAGREAAEHAAEGMSAVREMALQSVKKIKRLGESAQDIGEIAQMVSDFTSQTNLLALNAAIEAVRAGEHGRGFGVVAQEIRNLANSSADATKQIHARIRSIQNETNSVVVTIEHSTQKVVMQSELAAQAGAALEAVDMVTQRIARSVGEINDTATQQAETADRIARSMAATAETTTQTRDSMEQMRIAMDRLVELAQSLLRAISVFRLGGSAGQGVAALPPATAFSTAEQVTQPLPAMNSLFSGVGSTVHWSRNATAPVDVAKAESTRSMERGGATTTLPRSNAPLHPPTLVPVGGLAPDGSSTRLARPPVASDPLGAPKQSISHETASHETMNDLPQSLLETQKIVGGALEMLKKVVSGPLPIISEAQPVDVTPVEPLVHSGPLPPHEK